MVSFTEDSRSSGVSRALDDGALRGLQWRVVAICGLLIMLDGFDNQLMGVVAPLLSKDLHLDKGQMGLIFSITQIGATVGALIFGPLADRFGRKPAAAVSICVMTAFTWATTITPAFGALLFIRFCAGVGIAGIFSPALALTSEYAPLRLRGTMVAVVYAGYNVGAGLGGVLAAALLTGNDWRTVLYVGVALGLFALTMVILFLPESLRYLIAKRADRKRLQPLLNNLGIDPDALPPMALGSDAPPPARSSIFAPFRYGLLALTLLLCLMNACVSATSKVMITWLPTILSQDGFSVSQASLAQAGFAFGGVPAMLLTGWLIDRVGPARVIVPSMIVNALALVALSLAGASFVATFVSATMVGASVAVGAVGGQIMAARLFPVVMRSTGMGWGTAAARFGSIISPSVVAWFLLNGASSASVFRGLTIAPLLAAVMAAAFARSARSNRVKHTAEHATAA